MTDYSITSILSKSMEITISPKEVSFDSLYGIDAKIIEKMMMLLDLFTLIEDREDAEDADLIEIDGEYTLPMSDVIRDNVKKHMDEHPDEYIAAMKEIWMNMKTRAESWKVVDKTSKQYLNYIDEIPKQLMYNSEISLIEHCLYICEACEYYGHSDDVHENLNAMTKYYEYEAAIFVMLCIMILNPEYIGEYCNNVKKAIHKYFITTRYLQHEGHGICAILSLRYVRGMLCCDLMDDKDYLNSFKTNKPKGLEEDLHEEIIDEVDLFYAYAILMKYKLYPNLDIEAVMFAFLNDWVDSKHNSWGRGNMIYLLSKIEFEITRESKNSPIEDIASSILKNYGDDATNMLFKERSAYNFYKHLSNNSESYVYKSVPKKFTRRESIADVVKSARERVSGEFKNDSYYKCLHSVIFRRYIVGNRVKEIDNHTEFLLYLSYFHSILTLDKRKYMTNGNKAYNVLGHTGFYLNPVWFNIKIADDIKEEIMSCPCIKTEPFKAAVNYLSMFMDEEIKFNNDLPTSLRDMIINNIKNKEPISADDIYKCLLHVSLSDIYPDAKEIIGSNDTERLYFIIVAMISDKNPSYGGCRYLTMLKLQHETNELLKTVDVSKSSIPIFCFVDSIINDKKHDEKFEHGYVKELTNEGIIVYDPNLSFTKCSDTSITDIYLPKVSSTSYSFITKRIRFLGGNENKPLKIIALIFGFVSMIVIIIGLIIYFVNKDSNETFHNKGFRGTC